jgi:phage terminase large subunit-like protein
MTRGDRVVEFIHRYCIVPEGKLMGQPLRLMPFQEKFIREVYDNPAGTRTGILSIARKNGKSGLIAAIMLAHLVGPEAKQNSQIVSGARSRKQAAVVYNLAAKMVSLSPQLRKIIRLVPSSKKLIGLTMNTEYEALAAEAGSTHGLSPVLAIIDEMGQVKGETDAFVEAIETGQGAYDDPLELIISTQAATDSDMLSIRIDDARQHNDPRTVCHVYEAPPDAELLDREAWRLANPAMGVFRSEIELEGWAAKAARMPSEESGFRNLGLNQRVNRFDPFIARSVWEENGGPVDLEAFHRYPVYGGLDLSKTTDLCAFVLLCEDEDGIWHVKPTFWKPAALLHGHADRDRAPYVRWADEGLLLTPPGTVIDYGFVAKEIRNLIEGMDVRAIGFDRWRFDQLKPHIENHGLSVEIFQEVIQGPKTMSPALAALEIELLGGNLRHGGHQVLSMCAGNAVAVSDSNENRKLDKAKSTGRIDGMVALAIAFGVAPIAAENGNSHYESHDLLVI